MNFSFQNKRLLAKWLTALENKKSDAIEFLFQQSNTLGKAKRIGITGPPGTGKSTLVNALAMLLGNQHLKIAILAVDPSSPFTKGAILGDRIRMNELNKMENIFVRSIASRGHLGGLSMQINYMADALDIAGYDFIIYETVGTGQSELEIIHHADCVVVVLNPESGDSIQAMKAGLMEIANIFVVNKSDHPNTNQFIHQVEQILHLQSLKTETDMEVVRTIATENIGIDNLKKKIENFWDRHTKSGLLEQSRRLRKIEIIKMQIDDLVLQKFWSKDKKEKLQALVESGTNHNPENIFDLLTK